MLWLNIYAACSTRWPSCIDATLRPSAGRTTCTFHTQRFILIIHVTLSATVMCMFCLQINPLSTKTNSSIWKFLITPSSPKKITQHPQQYNWYVHYVDVWLPKNSGEDFYQPVNLPDCGCGVAFHPNLAKEVAHHHPEHDCDQNLLNDIHHQLHFHKHN